LVRDSKLSFCHFVSVSLIVSHERFSCALAGSEILDHPDLSKDPDALAAVIRTVRIIGQQSLKTKESAAARSMKRILKLFRKAAHSHSEAAHATFNAPLELLRFIRGNLSPTNQGGLMLSEELELIKFFASEAAPNDLLQALICLKEFSGYQAEVLPIVRTLLQRAAHESVSSEMSVALMKVKLARMEIEEQNIENKPMFDDTEAIPSQTIWQSMAHGMITIAK
jgi:hypothetical protein